jgi:hypothetical protein
MKDSLQKLFYRDERTAASVPLLISLVLILSLSVQVIWSLQKDEIKVEEKILPDPPRQSTLLLLGLNDPLVISKIAMLWLQAFDNQAGVSVPFQNLDYTTITKWLDLCLQLDPKSQYPLLASSRLYTLVSDEEKIREMINFTYEKFLEDPVGRWQWIAHSIYIAKHRLMDLDTALIYARALRVNTGEGDAPYWARHMEVYITEDLGDIEATKILIGGLLESGAVTDPNEIKFLTNRLKKLTD